MKDTKNKRISKTKVVKHSFTRGNITKYSGLNVVVKFLNRQGIINDLNKLLPTVFYNATKFSNFQILISIVLASLSGVNRISRIANFTEDGLIQTILRLSKAINENAISTGLKRLGQKGARELQSYLLSYKSKQLKDSGLKSITLDADSTVSVTY